MVDSFDRDLALAAEGDDEARRRLWSEHYEVLRSCAADYLQRQWGGADGMRISLGATDVLHEAYVRLAARLATIENGRRYFFRAFLQECMRIVIEHYRRSRNHRGRGAMARAPFDSECLPAHQAELGLDAIVEAIAALQQKDERAGQIAFLRVIENKTNAECAELLGFGMRTIESDWAFAKAWLDRELRR